jgi:hypothetical protein
MVLNQLFSEKPPLELINKIINKIGLKDINDNSEFTILDLNSHNSATNIRQFIDEIKECYIPCKRNKYVSEITNKTVITILRQFLKMYEYDLISREKYINGIKYLIYKIITKKDKELSKKNKKYINKKEITIVFD